MYFKGIPYAPGFSVSQCGIVKGPDGNIRETYVNGDGYVGVSIKTLDSEWVTFGVHRLVAQAYLQNDKPEERDQVNHFDMDKTNNHLRNLDWVTNEENLMHASLFVNEGRPDRLHIVHKETQKEYLTGGFQDAHQITGASIREIWDSLLGRCWFDHWVITYRPRRALVPPALVLPRGGLMKEAAVEVMDVTTGIVTAYPTIGQAAKALGVIPTAVRHALSENGKVKSLRKKFLVVRQGIPFPKVTLEELIASASNIAKSVLGYNLEENKWVILSSVNDFIRHTGLSTKTVRGQLTRHRIASAGNWVFTYVVDSSSEAVNRVMSYIKLQYNDVQIVGM